jgi:uncharacterized protein (DUF2249 family)
MDMASTTSRVIDLAGRFPPDAYGLVARVFTDLAVGEGFRLVSDRDLAALVGTFRLVWDQEFAVRTIEAGPERFAYEVMRAEPAARPSLDD